MNDDEARIRARLHEYADGIEPLSDLPAAGRARYRRLVRRRRATAVLAAAVVVIAGTGIGVGVARRSDRSLNVKTGHSSTIAPPTAVSTTTSSTSVAPGPVVTGEALSDTTWISTEEGWALVAADLLHTTDGGATWRSVSQLPDIKVPADGLGSDTCAAVACVDHVRFADKLHGYLFGRAFLTTDDGGVTWTRQLSYAVVALEVLDGRAFRVVSAHDCIAPGCTYFVETAKVGARSSWQRLDTPALVGDGVQLLYDAPNVYVAVYGNPAGGAGDAHIKLVRSLDLGQTWQLRSDPCGQPGTAEVDTRWLASAPNGFLVALCQPRGFDRAASVRTSSDAGTTFASPQPLPFAASVRVDAIAAGSPTSILVTAIDGDKHLASVSHDNGRSASWHTTVQESSSLGTPAPVVFLGFEDARVGRLALSAGALYTTRDGGETWTSSRP